MSERFFFLTLGVIIYVTGMILYGVALSNETFKDNFNRTVITKKGEDMMTASLWLYGACIGIFGSVAFFN